MTVPTEKTNPQKYVDTSPQSALERELLREYFRNQGIRMEDLHTMPREERKRLMKAACQYASLKLTEIEAKAGFRKKIKYDSG